MNMFRRDKGSTVPVVPSRSTQEELNNPMPHSLNSQDSGATSVSQGNSEVTDEPNPKQRSGVMGAVQKVNPSKTASKASSAVTKAPSSESLEQPTDSTQNPGMLKGVIQKLNPFQSSSQVSTAPSSESLEQGKGSDSTQNPGMFKGLIQKVNPFKSSAQLPKNPEDSTANSQEPDRVLEEKQNPGMMRGMIQKVNPFKSSPPKETRSPETDLSSSSGSLADHSVPVKQNPGMFKEMMQKVNPFRSNTQVADGACETDSVVPTNSIETQVQTLQLAEIPVPGEETQLYPLDDEEDLLSWWKSVEGWDGWNQAKKDDEAEEVVEEAADRVFMAARLFVRIFNQRGASLQQRILELLALADAADNFHKKTVTASMGGGLASVAGSVTTITGLILAPFTAGTSLIVTAVGIGIATAGGVTSASANITDTVHSKTDRNKVEKMIHDYQEEIRDIRECLEFLQEGMETLQDWNFEKYAESISEKHLNQNVKHVMKEGGRAGKALVINTESLISTVQVLGVAGGAAKAAQVMSVTTGVMAGLFLALDVFFLAKDSMELKKGAKTEFAAKIREVCKDLQDGLLELNRIKEQLQKTMDGIEVEVEEGEDEELLKANLKRLVEFGE